LQELQHGLVVIHTNGVVPSLRQRDEHPASTATQLKYRVAYLSCQVKPKRKVFKVPVMVCVVKLREHTMYWLV
jgi:hypothetical protein